ncbi:transcription factor TFIIE beta subunit, TFIIEB, Tfa2 [Tieghemiomyces parasiticus]|uniref:Transcription initiation factor IIE subunit beta n=1 Tax=Tieghemiomyces parasiticus TaxID=78921 RepID=A0A9W7ZXS6_9FUNG|nr:transcription factor TFIIE beta subunit, TFIIEB, Tfa2 [Tieghemiomyces parasiticus]
MSSLLREQADFKKRLAAQPSLKRHIVPRSADSENNLAAIGSQPPSAKKQRGESYFKDFRGRISTAVASAPVSATGSPLLTGQSSATRHAGTLVYHIINHLKKVCAPQTEEDIQTATGIQVNEVDNLRARLTENKKIIYDPDSETFEYKPDYDLRTKDDLLMLLQSRAYESGTDIKDLKDCVLNVREAAEPLVREGRVYTIRNKDNAPRLLFYNTHPAIRVSVGDEFKDLWHQVRVPDEADLSKELDFAGLKQMEVFQKKVTDPSDGKGKKAKQRNRRVKITNTHLEGIDLTKDYVVDAK